MEPAAAPRPIDPRGPRFNQAVLAAALLVGFLADGRAVVPLFAVVLLLGAALGPRFGPFLRLYADVIGPRLRPPAVLEDPRPPRFAAGAPGLGWALALVVAVLAGVAATTGLCVGCELYVLWARRRGVRIPT
jgi:hypothetical protein